MSIVTANHGVTWSTSTGQVVSSMGGISFADGTATAKKSSYVHTKSLQYDETSAYIGEIQPLVVSSGYALLQWIDGWIQLLEREQSNVHPPAVAGGIAGPHRHIRSSGE
jgi:hypothetical protein